MTHLLYALLAWAAVCAVLGFRAACNPAHDARRRAHLGTGMVDDAYAVFYWMGAYLCLEPLWRRRAA